MFARWQSIQRPGFVLTVFLLFGMLAGDAFSQTAWQKMKLQVLGQACNGGDQNACRQLALLKQKLSPQGQTPQSQQQPALQPQTAAQQRQPAYRPAAASAEPSAGSEPDSSCCTAEAMKSMAAAAGFIDVVGIKLGMTPREAVAAIKAHNPALEVKQVSMRLTHPGARTMVRVPHYIVAYNAEKPVGWEIIVVEFTTPPNPPVVGFISRYTNFEPTIAANLLGGLDKKYGPEYPLRIQHVWLFDQNGKPVTTSSQVADHCATDNESGVLPGGENAGGDATAIARENRDLGAMDVDTFKSFELAGASWTKRYQCMPYTTVWVSDNLAPSLGPNTQLTEITVTIRSDALAYAAERSSHEWLQAEADAINKTERDAAAKRTGTSF